jgi:hypothetical protein
MQQDVKYNISSIIYDKWINEVHISVGKNNSYHISAENKRSNDDKAVVKLADLIKRNFLNVNELLSELYVKAIP